MSLQKTSSFAAPPGTENKVKPQFTAGTEIYSAAFMSGNFTVIMHFLNRITPTVQVTVIKIEVNELAGILDLNGLVAFYGLKLEDLPMMLPNYEVIQQTIEIFRTSRRIEEVMSSECLLPCIGKPCT